MIEIKQYLRQRVWFRIFFITKSFTQRWRRFRCELRVKPNLLIAVFATD